MTDVIKDVFKDKKENFKLILNLSASGLVCFLVSGEPFLSEMPSTVEDASSETEKLGHGYTALHEKGLRVNEMGIGKSRGKETGMTDTSPCDVWGQERERERI